MKKRIRNAKMQGNSKPKNIDNILIIDAENKNNLKYTLEKKIKLRSGIYLKN